MFDQFDKEEKSMFKAFGVMAVFAALLNLAVWGSLIYFVFWCLKHFGIIG